MKGSLLKRLARVCETKVYKSLAQVTSPSYVGHGSRVRFDWRGRPNRRAGQPEMPYIAHAGSLLKRLARVCETKVYTSLAKVTSPVCVGHGSGSGPAGGFAPTAAGGHPRCYA